MLSNVKFNLYFQGLGPDKKDDKKDKDKKQVQFVKGHTHRADYLQHQAICPKKSGTAQMLKSRKQSILFPIQFYLQ